LIIPSLQQRVTGHWPLVIGHWLLFLLFLPTILSAQIDAGPDVTINPGVPVTLKATYGKLATGVPIAANGVSGPYDILFSFKFFGNIYEQFYIGANGWISFSSNPQAIGVDYAFSIPNSTNNDIPRNCILGPNEALFPVGNGSPFIYFDTVGQAPDRKLVVMWCQCPMKTCPDSTVTFQIILNETTHIIETRISNKPKCTTLSDDSFATLGIQDGSVTSSRGFVVPGKNYSIWEAHKEAWRFVPDATQDTYTPEPMPEYQLISITPGNKIVYNWFEGTSTELFSMDFSTVVSPMQTTKYFVVATICSGEKFTDSVTVTVLNPIPNAFSPNGDGVNDTFNILGLPVESITRYHIHIYNRWGQMVFSETDISNPWNGKMNNTGEECPDGVYGWVIFYEKEGTTTTNKGTLTLLR